MLYKAARGVYRPALQWLRRLDIYVRSLKASKRAPEQAFFILAQGRSGSRLLCDLLDKHPAIHCDMEILYHPRRYPMRYVVGKRNRVRGAAVYGFKVKIYQLTRKQGISEPRRFVEGLVGRGWKVIYLWRRNVLRQSLSVLMALQKGLWHATEHDKRKIEEKVRIDPEQLLDKARVRVRRLEEERAVLDGVPHLTINYEDDLKDSAKRDAALRRIFRFLDVPPVRVETEMRRTSKDDVSAQIINYEEVSAHLRGTEFARMI